MKTVTSACFEQPGGSFEMPKGLPRPLFEGQPVPYTSAVIEYETSAVARVAAIDFSRAGVCTQHRLCLLCGLPVENEGAVIGDGLTQIEIGLFHLRCARMTLRHCPRLRDDQSMSVYYGSLDGVTERDGAIPESFQRLERNRCHAAAPASTLLVDAFAA